LDETWANTDNGRERAWVEKDTITGGNLGVVPLVKDRGSSFFFKVFALI
jgi:hypothetical protein